MTYCPPCVTPRECDKRGCAQRECAAPLDLFGQSTVRYIVEGKGAFPMDMLRIDTSWPATKHAAARIINSYGGDERQTIELSGIRAPNFRAWLASSWQVKEINGVML